jgi:hypothetical protein
MNATISWPDMARLLGNVLPFTPKEDWREALSAVRMCIRADRIFAVAVDPSRIVVDSCEPMGAVAGGWDMSIPEAIAREVLGEAKALVKTAKRDKKDPGGFTVRTTDDGQQFEISSHVQARTFREDAKPFPDIYKVIWPFVAQPLAPMSRIAMSPRLLADYAKVDEALSGIRLHFREDGGTPATRFQPIEIRIGETFASLLMPIRIPNDKGFTPAVAPVVPVAP